MDFLKVLQTVFSVKQIYIYAFIHRTVHFLFVDLFKIKAECKTQIKEDTKYSVQITSLCISTIYISHSVSVCASIIVYTNILNAIVDCSYFVYIAI